MPSLSFAGRLFFACPIYTQIFTYNTTEDMSEQWMQTQICFKWTQQRNNSNDNELRSSSLTLHICVKTTTTTATTRKDEGTETETTLIITQKHTRVLCSSFFYVRICRQGRLLPTERTDRLLKTRSRLARAPFNPTLVAVSAMCPLRNTLHTHRTCIL